MTNQVISHAYKMIADNLSSVMKIVFMPWCITVLLRFTLDFAYHGTFLPTDAEIETSIANQPGSIIGLLSLAIINVLVYLWIIVGWHRFVLLGETPSGYFPNWHGGRNKAYFLKVFFIALIMIIPMISYTILMGAFFGGDVLELGLQGPSPLLFLIATLISSVVISYVSLRFSMVLPSVAIGEEMSLKESWMITKASSISIVSISIILSVLYSIPLVLEQVFPSQLIPTIVAIVISAAITLLSVSILTTLYGLLVEKRKLFD